LLGQPWQAMKVACDVKSYKPQSSAPNAMMR
jgi:hypothetical protein